MLDLSPTQRVRGATHWAAPLDQLYHPTGMLGQDTADTVYAADNLNTTKFTPVLLKEWFFLLRRGGYLVLDYQPNAQCGWQKLEETLWWLWRRRYRILYHGPVEAAEMADLDVARLAAFVDRWERHTRDNLDPRTLLPRPVPTRTSPAQPGGRLRLLLQKTAATTIPGDSMDCWSFGIITSGQRADWVEEIIRSIRAQGIPEYEILVCGTYYDRREPDFRYLPFNERDDMKWITRKKNLIFEAARHENICLVHDRLYLDSGWYEGMRRWGNCFESLSVPQLLEGTQERCADWCCLAGFDLNDPHRFVPLVGGAMEYRDWHRDVGGYAAVLIAKRSLLRSVWYNETSYWGRFEDHLMDADMLAAGVVLRMNPYAICWSKARSLMGYGWHYGFDPLRLGPRRDLNPVVWVGLHLLHALGVRRDSRILLPVKAVLKTRRGVRTHDNTGAGSKR